MARDRHGYSVELSGRKVQMILTQPDRRSKGENHEDMEDSNVKRDRRSRFRINAVELAIVWEGR